MLYSKISQTGRGWAQLNLIFQCLLFTAILSLQEKDPMQAKLDSIDKNFTPYDREK